MDDDGSLDWKFVSSTTILSIVRLVIPIIITVVINVLTILITINIILTVERRLSFPRRCRVLPEEFKPTRRRRAGAMFVGQVFSYAPRGHSWKTSDFKSL